MKKVLVTGQSGLNKSEYLNSVKELLSQKNILFNFKTIGHEMMKNYDGNVSENTILNFPKSMLDMLRKFTWSGILRDLSNEKHDVFAINTHAAFRWHHGMFPALDLDLVLEYDPDIVICVIDEILNIKRNLYKRGTDIFSLWELFAWREEEIWLSKFIAQSASKFLNKDVKFYIVPKPQGPELFARLISDSDVPKVYASFPITGLSREEEREIEEFKSKIQEHFIVFDPYSIKDRELTLTYYTLESEIKEKISVNKSEYSGTGRWKPYYDDLTPLALVEFNFDGIKILGRDLLSVLETIDSQIISRDYQLIDQSDFILTYIQDLGGQPRISAGCQSEMVYGFTTGKPVYAIYTGGEKKLSPWVTQYSKVFKSVDEALEFIIREHGGGG